MTPEVINSRAGGVYIPPFKLARMQRNVEDKSSPEYQRQTWEALRKSLNGIINKLFQENLIRGRGLFCRALMKAQLTSPGFTHVYAALVAIVNTKLPEVGELLLKRVVFQFRRAFKRNDKLVAVSLARFIAHLVNGAPGAAANLSAAGAPDERLGGDRGERDEGVRTVPERGVQRGSEP